MKSLREIGFGGCLLACSTTVAIGISCWLIRPGEDEIVHNISTDYDRLILQGRFQEAAALLNEAITGAPDGPLDPLWLPLMLQAKPNGYEQLVIYERVLAGDPERVDTYKGIAELIELAPQSFQDEVKLKYLESLQAIPGVRGDLLEKYNLLPDQQKPQQQPALTK